MSLFEKLKSIDWMRRLVKKIKISTVNQVWDLYKQIEKQYFTQYEKGLITSLELANQIIRLNKEQVKTIKNLFK